jgi:hypothetical protein
MLGVLSGRTLYDFLMRWFVAALVLCVSSVTLGQGQVQHQVIKYVNKKYGFTFSLPQTWADYSTSESTYDALNNGQWQHFPQITIKNPRSTAARPLKEIIVVVLTHAEWDSIEKGTLALSASSEGPGELGRNKRYVFVVPPRFYYKVDEKEPGFREVVQILHSNPLHAF